MRRNTRSKARARRSSNIGARASSSRRRAGRSRPRRSRTCAPSSSRSSPFSRGTRLPMPGRADRAVAVVIPAYQAAAKIADIVSRTSRAVPGATVYVVDDGSTDGTRDAGRGNGATLLVHPRNRGKGAALATGIAAALEGGAGIIITLDADGQHQPEQIPDLAAPVLNGAADLAVGAPGPAAAKPGGLGFTHLPTAAAR